MAYSYRVEVEYSLPHNGTGNPWGFGSLAMAAQKPLELRIAVWTLGGQSDEHWRAYAFLLYFLCFERGGEALFVLWWWLPWRGPFTVIARQIAILPTRRRGRKSPLIDMPPRVQVVAATRQARAARRAELGPLPLSVSPSHV